MNVTTSKPAIAKPTPHPSILFPEIQTCKTIRHLKQVHALFIKSGRIHDPLAAAEFLRFSAHHRHLHYARLLFHQMTFPNCFSYNTIIRALSESDDLDDAEEALKIFVQMLHDEFVNPNGFTFPSLLKACASSARIEEGKQIHGLVAKMGLDGNDEFVLSNLLRMYVMCCAMEDASVLFKTGVESRSENVVFWNVMIDGYVRIGDYEAAKQLFDRMPQRSVVSWNGMIAGYAQNGLFKEALGVFREMQLANVSPNYVTLVSVLPAISRLGVLELGKWVHLYADKNEVEIDEKLGSALIDMYSKCGSIDKAIQLFLKLPLRNAVTWNAIIGGLAMHGRAKDALDYFSKMGQEDILPNDITYIGVLSACSHAGLVEEGQQFFDQMMRSGLEPRMEHYGCMVDLLGRAGLFEEAEELIQSMPIKPDDIVWKALLNACKMHGNIVMGRRVAEQLMDLLPHDSGSYVALSNMYASANNWEGVAEVRLKMKEMDIRKDPGCSWIELDGVTHEFLVEDDSHPKATEIHGMLDEISENLKREGYRPNTTQVLLKMDEEDRENVLNYHSEKIAIAFGLINTSAQTPLRIVKNLRICEDCHSSIKLISKIYKRKITIRDRKRFHHFNNGECSCLDYW